MTSIELSVPCDSYLNIRHEFKCHKYVILASDQRQWDLDVTLHGLEVCSHVITAKLKLSSIPFYMICYQMTSPCCTMNLPNMPKCHALVYSCQKTIQNRGHHICNQHNLIVNIMLVNSIITVAS